MILQSYLNELAQYTNEKVTKAVLNGTYEISTFQVKQLTDSTLLMEYLVPAESVSEITLIELKSASGTVVSSNNVYIPVTSDTILKHTITVKEG
ncbi:ketopantoate hydroxymethyltransferase [Paenibacillus naphthalenovorans]|uniref:ketopantoate hydroxymethyltransferase n=1 Tax=Paenibacillus naphthalenovorans TaxID=162209 RepID=UPI0008836281|nr:ketopantoate hydroxymethyltransferase [Paenibacillus naphthalenovorans]SDJ76115.1 hypothetical protein SAMN05421868_1438 [Paenibacillus naphthalenovorans]